MLSVIPSVFRRRNKRTGRILRVGWDGEILGLSPGKYMAMCEFRLSGEAIGILSEEKSLVELGDGILCYDNACIIPPEKQLISNNSEMLEGKIIKTMRTSALVTTSGELFFQNNHNTYVPIITQSAVKQLGEEIILLEDKSVWLLSTKGTDSAIPIRVNFPIGLIPKWVSRANRGFNDYNPRIVEIFNPSMIVVSEENDLYYTNEIGKDFCKIKLIDDAKVEKAEIGQSGSVLVLTTDGKVIYFGRFNDDDPIEIFQTVIDLNGVKAKDIRLCYYGRFLILTIDRGLYLINNPSMIPKKIDYGTRRIKEMCFSNSDMCLLLV